MTKLRTHSALPCEAAGEGADFVVAADVNDRALEDRVSRKAVDHSLDLAIVEHAAIARKEIVDRRTVFEVALAHPVSSIRLVRANTTVAFCVLDGTAGRRLDGRGARGTRR
jgi:hypothetical protein